MVDSSPLMRELTAIDRLLYEVAGDLYGLGIADSQSGLHPEVEAVRQAAALELDVVRQSLQELQQKALLVRRRHVARQLAAVGARAPLKLALTGTPLPGWVTIGFPPAPLTLNLRWGIPFADGAAELVYFALALEHVYYRDEALSLLREVRRVLRTGGRLRVVVPDLAKYLRAYAEGNERFFAVHRDFWDWARHARTSLDLILMMTGAGMGRGPGDFFGHKTGYDLETLRQLLIDAGFTRIEERTFMDSARPELCIDHASHDAGFGDGTQNFNLFVEAE